MARQGFRKPRLAPLLASAALAALACSGSELPDGKVDGPPRPVAAAPGERQILFGDLHVHTIWSVDAFLYGLPIFGGQGVHPPSDACDFARYCSALDFFSINDHAEGLLPERWQGTVEAIRACNERAGDPENPDLVAFLGWEWTQVGQTPENHYGHKNVILPGLADDEIPARPITSLTPGDFEGRPDQWKLELGERALWRPYSSFVRWVGRLNQLEECPAGVPSPQLPRDCRENATNPGELFRKLDEWGLPFLVIPHGLAWGVHAPPGARLDLALQGDDYDPERERLLEVYSGHGSGEAFRLASLRKGGEREVCPVPTEEFLPCCWRAGEIMRARCGDLPAEECDRRVEEARRLALRAGTSPHLVFPDVPLTEWLDCDQCRDCFKPAFNLRPGMTAQYGAALSQRGEDGEDRRLRWGFIGSSDDHHGRPGTGYKQVHRKGMADVRGFTSERVQNLLQRASGREEVDPRVPQPGQRRTRTLGSLFDVERTASFLYPGGLAAVHSEGRSRRAIWEALERREVYGTSGPRILLWFELANGPGGPEPMGSEVAFPADGAPRFRVRAVGAHVQQPGCPDSARDALGGRQVERLCMEECHHPGDERHRIDRVEVVRIRSQRDADEHPARLIEDPWFVIECPPDPEGCSVEFEDPDYAAAGRDTLYYVRALQEPTPAVNGANVRTTFDAVRHPTGVEPCYGDWRTPDDDDCLAPVQERAWSSPIWLDRAAASDRDG